MIQHGDLLLERAKLKRQLSIWKLLLLLAVIAVAALAIGHGDGSGLPRYMPYIARISIDDVMWDERERVALIKKIADDHFAKAVIISIDSPGGTAVAGEEIYIAIRHLAEKKPVVAVMRELATSAAYMSAIATDRIFAREGTITGSVGVLFQSFEAVDLAEKIGIKPINVKSGVLKASPQPLERATPEAMQSMQSVVADFYRYFIGIVKERRNLGEAEIKQVADGRIFTGRQALAIKLVDEIGGEDEAVKWLSKEKSVPESLPVEDADSDDDASAWFDHAAKSFSGNLLPKMTGNINGLAAIWRP